MRLDSPASGHIREVLCRPGREAARGQRLLVVQT